MRTDANFAARAQTDEHPRCIRWVTDCDHYQDNMGDFIAKQGWADHRVRFALTNRSKMPLAKIIPREQLSWELEHLQNLQFNQFKEGRALRGINLDKDYLYSPHYVESMYGYRMPQITFEERGDQYAIGVEGKWLPAIRPETQIMATLTELMSTNVMRKMSRQDLEIMYGRAKDKLWRKLELLKKKPGIRFADFGQRRRHSFLWQQWVVDTCMDIFGYDKHLARGTLDQCQFMGTSNTLIANELGCELIGTFAHALIMFLTALARTTDERLKAQYVVHKLWLETYGGKLAIGLPDTYGTKQFFLFAERFGFLEVLLQYRGWRIDSMDPIKAGEFIINWWKSHGVDPRTKVLIFSDGLDVDEMCRIYDHFNGQVIVLFGWGTNLTNDFHGCHPRPDEIVPEWGLTWDKLMSGFSIVIKPSEILIGETWEPVTKLSDNFKKATGPQETRDAYWSLFGTDGIENLPVNV